MLKIDLNSVKDIHKEARRLFNKEKLPDQPFECWRGETKCLEFKSLKWAAEHALKEKDRLFYKKFRAFNWVKNEQTA